MAVRSSRQPGGRAANPRPLATFFAVALVLCCRAAPVHAQIAVVANLTDREVRFTLLPSANSNEADRDNTESSVAARTLVRGDVAAIWVGKGAAIRELSGAANQSAPPADLFTILPGGAYYWIEADGKRMLNSIELGAVEESALPGVRSPTELTVKVLVDDDETTVDRLWHRVLAARVAAASEILERTCRVRLRVIGFDRWESPAETKGLEDGLVAFERQIDPAPAQVAIGFSSQYVVLDEETPHLGVIRGPLGRHMLIRERAGRLTEPEKLEILVHELGHYFGAAHVAHPRSVMRPRLADGQARLRSFRIAFDPINALIMNHYVTELHAGRQPSGFPAPVATRIRQLKQILAGVNQSATDASMPTRPEETGRRGISDELTRREPVMPETPSAKRQGDTSESIRPETRSSTRLTGAIRELLAEFRAAPERADTGEAVTDWYVRRLARAAQELPPDIAPKAFLIALGIGFDDTTLLRTSPLVGPWIERLETADQRNERLPHVRRATLGGRHDLALHFFVSGMLTAQYGEGAAAWAGLLKEIRDASGGSGFDETDLAADEAGIRWAKRILRRRVLLLELAENFRAPDVRRGRVRRGKR